MTYSHLVLFGFTHKPSAVHFTSQRKSLCLTLSNKLFDLGLADSCHESITPCYCSHRPCVWGCVHCYYTFCRKVIEELQRPQPKPLEVDRLIHHHTEKMRRFYNMQLRFT